MREGELSATWDTSGVVVGTCGGKMTVKIDILRSGGRLP
jgi:hypothetical protein